MKRALYISLTAGSLVFAVAHCAASGKDAESTPTDDAAATETGLASEAGVTETGVVTDAAPDVNDAGTDGVFVPFDAGHCSPDGWCRTAIPRNDIDMASVWSFAPDDALAVGNDGLLHWDGASWSLVPTGDAGVAGCTQLWGHGANEVWAIAAGQTRLLHGTRSGPGPFTWTSSESAAGAHRQLITGAPNGDLWIAGNTDDGAQTLEHGVASDGGAEPNFELVPVTTSTPLFSLTALFAPSPERLVVAGSTDNAVVVEAKRSDGGFAWADSLAETQNFFVALWGASSDDVWVMASQTEHFHGVRGADGGLAWSGVQSHANVATAAAWGSGPSDVWTVGYFGSIRHWDGSAWSVSQVAINNTPMYLPLSAVHGSSKDDVWAVGPGIAMHRTSGGTP